MQTALFHLALGALLGCLACASPIEVMLDPAADPERWQSWDWLSDTGLLVQTPESERPGAERRLSHAIRAGFAERGYERNRGRPDLRVGVVLTARPVLRLRSQMGAVESITAYHNGSFEVQASEKRLDRLYVYRLEIYVSEQRTGRLVWQGRLADQTSGNELSALKEGVAKLLTEFPQRIEPSPKVIVQRAGVR